MYKAELLLPVGNYQMCLAAIHNGADAIYVGMPEFNARGRTHDHSWQELKEIIEICHLYGVQVHLAFNILIFQEEISKALEVLDRAMDLGPDALIVQDIGMISLIRSKYPDIVIHGSTQMTVTNHEAIELLDDLNINRFVLGRENSLDEIEKIKKNTNKELEVFVHGALCVAYSGQCFTSEALGGRSANRGQCAQSCRFDYEIYVDGEKKDLGINKYLVSPKDLCGINEIPKLMDLKIESFKVEGRLKSPEYVGTVARSYKNSINGNFDKLSESIEEMGVTYSRGFYNGWLDGVAHQNLVDGSYKENRGHELGVVTEVLRNEIIVKTKTNLKKGDGLLFVIESLNEVKEVGEKIYDINTKGNFHHIKLGPKISYSEVKKGCKVFLTRKEALIKKVNQSIVNKELLKRIPITIEVLGSLDHPLQIFVSDGINKFELKSVELLEKSQNRPLQTADFEKGLCGLSHSAYIVNSLTNNTVGDVFIHNREIKQLKQKFIELLNLKRTSPREINKNKIQLNIKPKNNKADNPKLNVLVRKKEQLESLLDYILSHDEYRKDINFIILDFEFGKDYFSSINLLKAALIKCAIATTRILKPNEYHNLKLIERCKPDGILVRNLGALNYFKGTDYELIGDFSLNCSNSYTYDYLNTKGLVSVCASYDLNINRLNKLITSIDTSKLEITIHQYMPEFHMEHCVFAAFLSNGNSFKDCGKPCEKHQVHLTDMYGNRHEIKADQECRNTMFNGKAQSTIKYIQDWQGKGVSKFRFECLHETGIELVQKLETYLKLINHDIDEKTAFNKLGEIESYGLSTGQLEKVQGYKNRKKT